VIARTTAVIEPGGVLGELACTPPLTLRQVYSDVPGRCELRLVGTAAGPLAGDDLSIRLRLRPAARATLRATGASVAQGRSQHGQVQHGQVQHGQGQRNPADAAVAAVLPITATLAIRAELGDGADLVADPGALVVCQGSRIDVRVELALGDGAAVEWRELIVLGRTGEPPGAATLRWDVTRLGRPVLRQFTDLDPGSGTAPGDRLTAGRRVLACALIAGPVTAARTIAAAATAVAQRVDDQTLLVTVLDDDAASATRRLDDLCARARPPR
jgi:urease accessory protein